MMAALNGFNRLAPIYDPLKRLVFGDAIYRSAARYLNAIPAGARVLVIGGGTGEVLTALMASDPSCEIWFIEASSEMLRRAQQRVAHLPARVHFIHGTEDDIPDGIRFEAIHMSFFLDVFPDEALPALCGRLASVLHPAGVWLVSDFVDSGSSWHRHLLTVMYSFFRRVSDVGAKSLPRWQEHIEHAGWKESASGMFYADFIKSAVYRKLSC